MQVLIRRRALATQTLSGETRPRRRRLRQRLPLRLIVRIWDVVETSGFFLKAASAAHRAVVTRLAVRLERAGLLFLKFTENLICDSFGYCETVC